MERRQDEIEELTKQLRQSALSAAARANELAAIQAELVSQKAKEDSLDEA